MLSTLINYRDEIQQAVSEINDKIEELQNAVYEFERAEESISALIDSLETVDGLSVAVEIESLSLDISVDL